MSAKWIHTWNFSFGTCRKVKNDFLMTLPFVHQISKIQLLRKSQRGLATILYEILPSPYLYLCNLLCLLSCSYLLFIQSSFKVYALSFHPYYEDSDVLPLVFEVDKSIETYDLQPITQNREKIEYWAQRLIMKKNVSKRWIHQWPFKRIQK